MPTDTRQFLRVPEIAARFGLSESFFNNKRVSGDGPPFLRAGRAVLYDVAEVEAWLRASRCASTSARAGA